MVNGLRIGMGLIGLIKLYQGMHTYLKNWMESKISSSRQWPTSQEIFPEHVGRRVMKPV
jgi:hypothetical protein